MRGLWPGHSMIAAESSITRSALEEFYRSLKTIPTIRKTIRNPNCLEEAHRPVKPMRGKYVENSFSQAIESASTGAMQWRETLQRSGHSALLTSALQKAALR